MAIDILLIPAMSVDPKRLFSGAKITITDRRNQLSIATIQALECLKSWIGILEIKVNTLEDELQAGDDKVRDTKVMEVKGSGSEVWYFSGSEVLEALELVTISQYKQYITIEYDIPYSYITRYDINNLILRLYFEPLYYAILYCLYYYPHCV